MRPKSLENLRWRGRHLGGSRVVFRSTTDAAIWTQLLADADAHSRVLSASLIVEARRRAGLSQRELAFRLGKRQAEIARWERGHVIPSLEAVGGPVGAQRVRMRERPGVPVSNGATMLAKR